MIAAAKWARTTNTPYLGVCLGMQMAVIEYARHVCDLPRAVSAESTPTPRSPDIDTVIVPMEDIDQEVLGGTMRLGLQPTIFEPGTEWSKLRTLYDHSSPHSNPTDKSTLRQKEAKDPRVILERHRHRYEVNPAYIARLQAGGMHFIGKDDKGVRMEIVELKTHPFYVGVQFHPEYLSRVLEPSKPYLGFVAASGGCLEELLTRARRRMSLINGLSNGHSSQEDVQDLVNGMGGVTV